MPATAKPNAPTINARNGHDNVDSAWRMPGLTNRNTLGSE